MRLPSRTEITGREQLHVYEHDVQELHGVRNTPARIKYLSQLDLVTQIVRDLHPERLLDVGCAQGNLAILLLEAGISVVACDLREEFLGYARMKNDSGTGDFVAASAYRLPFRSRSFDALFVGELIEHLASPHELLRECWRLLHPGGHLILTTPNGRNFFSRLPTYQEFDGTANLSAAQCGPDADGHLFLFTPQELTEALRRSGFLPGGIHFVKSTVFNNHLEPLFVRAPLRLSLGLDKVLATVPGLKRMLCEGMVVVAERLATDGGNGSGIA